MRDDSQEEQCFSLRSSPSIPSLDPLFSSLRVPSSTLLTRESPTSVPWCQSLIRRFKVNLKYGRARVPLGLTLMKSDRSTVGLVSPSVS